MSGGYFNSNEYIYYKVEQFADELEHEIENNDCVNQYNYSHSYNEETIWTLKVALEEIRRVAEIMKAIDYLYSGDYGEDSFLKEIKKSQNKL